MVRFTRPRHFSTMKDARMAELTICRGLRKLEFMSADDEGEEIAHARIEFAREAPLPDGEPVHISLGMREGKLRTLVGVPHLVKEHAAPSRREYLYRLSGQITEQST
jgi:hypothetical protein